MKSHLARVKKNDYSSHSISICSKHQLSQPIILIKSSLCAKCVDDNLHKNFLLQQNNAK